ncbi:MAG: hypothetical protein WCV55_01470 [Candidatus Paceibacterota bacterium]
MKNEHHAIFFEGNFKTDIDAVIDFFADDLEFGIQGNPDILIFTNEKLGVEKAREVRQYAQALPLKERSLHIIIGFDSATLEAQNALLKSLEEPGVSAKFYILVPSFKSIIPTLRSRMMHIALPNKTEQVLFKKEISEFIKGGKGKRIKIVEKIADDLKEEKLSKSDIFIFLKILKDEVLNQSTWELGSQVGELISSIATAEKYLESSSSVKQLLSLVALS